MHFNRSAILVNELAPSRRNRRKVTYTGLSAKFSHDTGDMLYTSCWDGNKKPQVTALLPKDLANEIF